MPNFNEIYQRILLVSQTHTQVELAAFLGIQQSSIASAKKHGTVPPQWYLTVLEKQGVNPAWLKTGRGSVYLLAVEGADQHSLPHSPPSPLLRPVLAPVFGMTGSSAKRHTKHYLVLPEHLVPSGTIIVQAEDNVMAPEIRAHAYVGIDTSRKQGTDGALYAVDIPRQGMVLRRFYMDIPNRRILLKADDSRCPSLELVLRIFAKHVLGRVDWVIQKL